MIFSVQKLVEGKWVEDSLKKAKSRRQLVKQLRADGVMSPGNNGTVKVVSAEGDDV